MCLFWYVTALIAHDNIGGPWIIGQREIDMDIHMHFFRFYNCVYFQIVPIKWQLKKNKI